MNANVGTALLLTTVAGLATTLGGLIGVARARPGPRFMSASLGFAAGVMIFVSFVELLRAAADDLGFLWANVAFFSGIAAMFAIDALVPHEYFGEHYARGADGRLLRTGLFVAIGIAIHNFPEGLATFAGALKDIRLGGAIAFAIAVHNIPEGLAVAVPVLSATGSRRKALTYSFLSGMTEPAATIIAAAVLYPFLNAAFVGWVMGVVAGLMVYVALDELVPASREYGHDHVAIVSAAGGMAIMSASLWLFRLR